MVLLRSRLARVDASYASASLMRAWKQEMKVATSTVDFGVR
jgi:hypothetical protein